MSELPVPAQVVAYYMRHNGRAETGILDGPGQSVGLGVDGEIRTFSARDEAEEWLAGRNRVAGTIPSQDRPGLTMAAVLTCCGMPMVYREVFGIRVFSCVYRNHAQLYVKGDQVISEDDLPVHAQERRSTSAPGDDGAEW